MKDNTKNIQYGLKSFFKYLYLVISWTFFTLLVILGVLLIYYYVSVRLYAAKGDKYEPKFSIYTVVTGSMEPTIHVSDVIVNVKVDSIKDVKVNDVITFISNWQVNYGMTMTHRVVDTQTLDDGSICLVTRGDNVTQEDQACVSEENLIGVVKAVIPGVGKLQAFLSSTLGWLLIIIVPALYVIIHDIIKIFGLVKKEDTDASNKDNDNEKNKDKKDIKLKENIKKDDEDYKLELPKIKEKVNKEIDKKNDDGNKDNDDLSAEERLEKAYRDLEKVRFK